MILDLLTTPELDHLHAALCDAAVALGDRFIAGCQADMTRTSGWFAGSPEAETLKAAMTEQGELAREVYDTLKARYAEAEILRELTRDA